MTDALRSSDKISSDEALERRHDVATYARDMAIAQCAEQTEARRSAEKLAEEQEEESTENEQRLRLDTTETLAEEHER